MKIEITDRAAWLERVESEIEKIKAERERRDAEYIDRWRRSFSGRMALRFDSNAMPPGESCIYPSAYAWGTMHTLREMRLALRSENTGAIYFDAEELRAAL